MDVRSSLVNDVGSQVATFVDQAAERVGRLRAVLVTLSGRVLGSGVLAETSETLGIVEGGSSKVGSLRREGSGSLVAVGHDV